MKIQEEKVVYVNRINRGRSNYITQIYGLHLFGRLYVYFSLGVSLKDAAKLIRKERATGGAVTPYEQDPSQECLELQGDLRTFVPDFISKHYPDIPESAIKIKEVADDVKKKK